MKKTLLSTVAILAVLFSASSAVAAVPAKPSKEVEQTVGTSGDYKFKFTTGADYSVGDYGQSSSTQIWYVPFTGKVERDNWTFKITAPWLRIKGPGAVLGGGDGGVTTKTTSTVVKTESGLGDVVTSLGYSFDLPYTTYLDLTGKVKLPTADKDRGLGTGETDYTTQFDLTKQFDALTVFAGAGYKFVGSNKTLDLRDVPLANVGFGVDVMPELNVGTSYDWRQSASRGSNPSESTFYANYKITKQVNLQAYGVVGYTDGSPDHGFGIMLGYKL